VVQTPGYESGGARNSDVVLPSGVQVVTRLNEQISTETTDTGAPFSARVSRPVWHDGVVAIPVDWTVRGSVTRSDPAARVGGTSRLSLRIDEVVTPRGEIFALDAHELRLEGTSTAEGDAEKVLGGALGGIVIGGLLGGAEGAKKGAAGGAVAGGIYAVMTRGNDIVLAAGTEVAFILEDELALPTLATRYR
jgi:hypothetical protein